jgi:hypothetical protein
VESLQSHCIHPQFHWSSGPPVCFPSGGTWVQSLGGYICETGILQLVLSRYIGDPDIIDHCGLWPGFMIAAGPPSSFTTDIVGCWGGALWRACNLTAFTHSFTGPVVHPFASRQEGPGFNPQGGLM